MSPVPQPIHEAIKNCKTSDALRMLEIDSSLSNRPDSSDNTPLWYAVQGFAKLGEKRLQLVKALLDRGADCNQSPKSDNPDLKGVTVFEASLLYVRENIRDEDGLILVEMLLKAGANANVPMRLEGADGSPLCFSICLFKENWDVSLALLTMLLKYGSDPNYTILVGSDEEEETGACSVNALGLLFTMQLDSSKTQIVAEILLSHGASVNINAEADGGNQIIVQPLHIALLKIINLVEDSSDSDADSDSGDSGADSGTLSLVKLCLQKGADTNSPIQFPNATTLQKAPLLLFLKMWAENGSSLYEDVIMALLSHGTNPNVSLVGFEEEEEEDVCIGEINAQGMTALQISILAFRQHPEKGLLIVKSLLENGADPNKGPATNDDSVGIHALQLAVDMFGQTQNQRLCHELFVMLLQYGADANQLVSNSNGIQVNIIQFAIEMVASSQNSAARESGLVLAKALLQRGADLKLTIENTDGSVQTALQLALQTCLTSGTVGVCLVRDLFTHRMQQGGAFSAEEFQQLNVALHFLQQNHVVDNLDLVNDFDQVIKSRQSTESQF